MPEPVLARHSCVNAPNFSSAAVIEHWHNQRSILRLPDTVLEDIIYQLGMQAASPLPTCCSRMRHLFGSAVFDKRLAHTWFDGRYDWMGSTLSARYCTLQGLRSSGTNQLFNRLCESECLRVFEHELRREATSEATAAHVCNKALCHSAAHGSLRMCERLLLLGADINWVDAECFGATALMQAVFHGQTGSVRMLLAHSAKLELRNNTFGQTALAVACSRGQWEIAALLVNAGACTVIEDDDGWTPLRISISKFAEAAAHSNLGSFLVARGHGCGVLTQ